MSTERWAAIKLRVWAEIEGLRGPVEVSQYSASFELNTIPQATLQLAVGRHVRTGVIAQAHQIRNLLPRTKVRVYLQVRLLGRKDLPDDWGLAAKQPVLIFEGFLLGTGWRRSRQQAAFLLHVQHWLGDLHYASALSGATHPANPLAFTQAALHIPMNVGPGATGGSGKAARHWIPYTRLGRNGLQFEEVSGPVGELWLKVLRPWMEEVSNTDIIDPNIYRGATNPEALAALARLTQNAPGLSLGMDLGTTGDAATIVGDIQTYLQETIGASDLNTTLWGKLVGEWAPTFMFSVSPRVKDALLFPQVGALRTISNRLLASEIERCEIHGQIPQLLRCVGLAHTVSDRTGFAGLLSAQDGQTLAAVWPDNIQSTSAPGLVLIRELPPWLRHPLSFPSRTETNAPVASAYAPVGVIPAPAPPASLATRRRTLRDIALKYAQQLFIAEQLKGRVGEVSGKLRFDIAPGSHVLVEGGQERSIPDDLLGAPSYGQVVRVSYTIDAEASRAETSFMLAWLRNERENDDPRFTTDVPALYKQGWPGGPLIDLATP